MFANRIHPDETGKLWVADRNVARNTLRVTMASPVAENGGHMQHNVLTVLVKGGESRNAWHTGG